jgi:hypothetical protein
LSRQQVHVYLFFNRRRDRNVPWSGQSSAAIASGGRLSLRAVAFGAPSDIEAK